MRIRPPLRAAASLALLLMASPAPAGEPLAARLTLLVKSEGTTCSATLLPQRSPLREVVPGVRLFHKDTREFGDRPFLRSCEVQVPREAFTAEFGYCALAGGTANCWMSMHYAGGRFVELSASGPGTSEACTFVCTGG